MMTNDILQKLQGVKKTGDKQWQARCPAHNDNVASLSIGTGSDGRTLLKCQAGCSTKSICDSLGIDLVDLFVNKKQQNKIHSKIIKLYDYRKDGQLLHQTVRYYPKGFRQRRPNGKGGWIWSLKGVDPVLYNYDEIVNSEIIFIVEGEKDADNLSVMGLTATTCPMGAKAWKDRYSDVLRGKTAVLLPDNDSSGQEHMRSVAKSLWSKAAEIKIVKLPDLPDKGDVSDWIKAGGTKQDLLNIIENSRPVTEPDLNEPDTEDDYIKLPDDHPNTFAEYFEEWSINKCGVKHRYNSIDGWSIYHNDRYQSVEDEKEVEVYIRQFLKKCKIKARKKVKNEETGKDEYETYFTRPDKKHKSPAFINSIIRWIRDIPDVHLRPGQKAPCSLSCQVNFINLLNFLKKYKLIK